MHLTVRIVNLRYDDGRQCVSGVRAEGYESPRVTVSCRTQGDYAIIFGMEKLAADIYTTFEKFIRNDFTYIDKTDRLWPLVSKRRLP